VYNSKKYLMWYILVKPGESHPAFRRNIPPFGGRSVGMVRSRTQATQFSFSLVYISPLSSEQLHAGILLGLLFDAEDGNDICSRNVGWLSPNSQRYIALHIHSSDSLKCNMCNNLQELLTAVRDPVMEMNQWQFLSAGITERCVSFLQGLR
jgi:hypothetical protein